MTQMNPINILMKNLTLICGKETMAKKISNIRCVCTDGMDLCFIASEIRGLFCFSFEVGWKIYHSQAGQLKMQQTFLKALK